MAAKPKRPHKAKPTHKGRKIGRSYRWAGVTHSTTKYRARHGIAPEAKRR